MERRRKPSPEKSTTTQLFVHYDTVPVVAIKGKQFLVSYRSAEESSVPQRRYYVGYVQVAYACYKDGKWKMYATHASGEQCLDGTELSTEKEMHEWLEKQLTP